jgi:hypothetical protein
MDTLPKQRASDMWDDLLAPYEVRAVIFTAEVLRQRAFDLAIGTELNRLQGERTNEGVRRIDRLWLNGQVTNAEAVAITREACRLGLFDDAL